MYNISRCKQRHRYVEILHLMPLFGFGSTRSGKGTDVGEASATAMCKTLRKRQAEEMGIEHIHYPYQEVTLRARQKLPIMSQLLDANKKKLKIKM